MTAASATGRISLNRFVELTSTSPAKIFGLFPRKGHHRAGLRRRHRHLRSQPEDDAVGTTHHMKVDYNPYEGREVTGVTDTVLSRGRVIIESGQVRRTRRRRPLHQTERAVVDDAHGVRSPITS